MPSNPYSSGAAFPDLSGSINNFTDNLVRLKTHQEDIDMRGRALQETTRQHDLQLPIQQGNLDVARGNLVETGRARATAEEANRLASEKFQTENPQAQPWNISNFMRLNSKLKLAGIPVDDIPFMNDLKTYAADPTMKRGDVAQAVEMNWPEWTAQTADALTQKVSKLSEQAANLPENDPKRGEIMKQVEKTIKAQQMLEGIPADKVKQTLFPDVVQWEQKQAEHQKQIGMDQIKAAISLKAMRGETLTADEKALVGIAPKAPVTRSVAPGGALVGPEGNVLYSNPTRPEANRPVSVAPGGTLVNPQTGAPIYTAPNKPDKGTTETELRAQRKELADNESKLLLNKTNEGAGPLADLHNERSEKPYSYQWKPGKLYGGEYVQVKLPKIKGKQVTAKDVYDTASQRGMTYDEVLRAIGVR